MRCIYERMCSTTSTSLVLEINALHKKAQSILLINAISINSMINKNIDKHDHFDFSYFCWFKTQAKHTYNKKAFSEHAIQIGGHILLKLIFKINKRI